MTRRSVLSIPTVIAAFGVAEPASGQGGPISVSFAGNQAGTLPAEFSIARTGVGAPADWTIVEDATVAAGRVLAQTSTDRRDYRFPLAIYQPVTAVNVEVTVRIKAFAGDIDRAGGIAVRLLDPDNYYVVRANALEDNVNLYRVIKGRRTEIRGTRQKVSSGTWHKLGLRAVGDRFRVSFDGADLFSASDRSLAGAGKVALWTKADSVTWFDALTIQTLP
jgi:hypothetical protein